MKIAILSDIHGNHIALNAVLHELRRESIDQNICLGDVSATGPQPRECLTAVSDLDCLFVMGNADAWLLDPKIDSEKEGDQKIIEEIDLWCAEQLDERDRAKITEFEGEVSLNSLSILAFHGSPRSYNDAIRAETPASEIEQMLGNCRAKLLLGGHTHQTTVRHLGESLYINPGSVGMPYEVRRSSGEVYAPPWAEYAVIEISDSTTGIEMRRAKVNRDEVISAALESGMPHAEWWTSWWQK